ncbi:hypothetical protein LI177_07540 [bacterium 210820-DFI.6.37]|nr:hypothetical protein [bacterium 210820-DFI.6.37]
MNDIRSEKEKGVLKKHKDWRRWKKLVGIMACLVVFCTTYALILPAITLSAETISAGGSAEIGIGDTVTLKGTSGNRNNWSASPEGCVTIQTSGTDATVTGTAAGTVTITHTYTNKGASEFFTVTVKDSSGSDAEKQATTSGYTVTVKGNKSVLTDDVTLHVEDYGTGEADYSSYYDALTADLKKEASLENIDESSFAFLHMYHIYLTKTGVEGECIPEGNVNLQVTITYNTAPENWNKVSWVGHYKKKDGAVSRQEISDGSTSSTGVKQIKVSGNSITFHIQSFSVFPVAALSEDSGGDESGSGETADGSVLTADHLNWLGADKSNEWQIVSQGYEGNAGSNKKKSEDGNVRVQKNVIPTGTENEFLVYLSIDTKQLFADYFASATYKATTSNNYHDSNLGTVVDLMTGNKTVEVVGKSTKYENNAQFTVLSSKGELLAENITLYWSQANNITIYLQIGDGGSETYVLTGLSIKSGDSEVVMLSEEAERLIMSDVAQKAILDQVTDEMGGYIEFESVVAGDYDTEPTYNESTRTLTWIPKIKENPTIDKVKTDESKEVEWMDHDGKVRTETVYKYESWALNVSELVYKVRLDVSKTGFNSAAENINSQEGAAESYKVNNSATLEYDDGTVDFQQPYVRGLLYDVEFDKVNREDTTEKLQGAVFELKDSKGDTYSVNEVKDDAGIGTGTYRAENLPCGTYTLTETKAPAGYQKSQDNPEEWKISVCYTENQENLKQDPQKEANMLYIRTDENGHLLTDGWQIKNDPIYVDLIKTDMSYAVLAGAEFSIYNADPSDDNAVPMDGYENITVGEGGVIADNFKVEPDTTYYIVETKAPDGYNLPKDSVKLALSKDGNNAQPVTVTGGSGTAEIGDGGKQPITVANQSLTYETTVYVIQLPNNPGYKLPDTGGPGSWIYYLSGGLLLLAASVIYGYSARRKRERRLKV